MNKDMLKMGFFLAVVAAVAALFLSLTYVGTKDQIKMQEEMALKASLKKVMPQAERFDEHKPSCYAGYRGSTKVGECLRVFAYGYSGEIGMLVGISPLGKITGVEILKIAETPGLGLNAQNPKFLDQYKGKILKDKFKAGEDIHALTGATITTNAISKGVKKALLEFKGNKEQQK